MEYIFKILKAWKEESMMERGVIQFKYNYSTGILVLYTTYPGWLIGKAGCHINKYTEIFKNEIYGFNSIEFIQTDYNYVV